MSTFEKRYTKSIGKSNRNSLGAARLVCMEVNDLPNPVEGCRRLPGMRMLRRNAFGMGLGKKPARWTREKVTEVPNDKKNGRLRPCMI